LQVQTPEYGNVEENLWQVKRSFSWENLGVLKANPSTRGAYLYPEPHYAKQGSESAPLRILIPVGLFSRPPIVEISALTQPRRVCLFNYLRVALQLPSKRLIAAREQMLRITRKANGEVVFRVSGQLTGENVTEIEALIAAERKGSRIVLDLTDLRSVDSEAVKFLEKREADSIKLKNCGLYIREWIRRERLERESDKSLET
jgi:hypothetical protein